MGLEMQAIYYCESRAYRSERDFLALTSAAERRQAKRVAIPPELRARAPFFLLHYSADVDAHAPEAVASLEPIHEQFLRDGLIERVEMMTWNGAFYSATASVATEIPQPQ